MNTSTVIQIEGTDHVGYVSEQFSTDATNGTTSVVAIVSLPRITSEVKEFRIGNDLYTVSSQRSVFGAKTVLVGNITTSRRVLGEL